MLENVPIYDNLIKTPLKSFIYEDAQCIVYEEVNQPTSMYFSVVPKKPISTAKVSAEDEKLLGHLLLVAKKIAIYKGFNGSGYHVKITEDPKSEQVLSLHIANKILQPVLWPMTPNNRL